MNNDDDFNTSTFAPLLKPKCFGYVLYESNASQAWTPCKKCKECFCFKSCTSTSATRNMMHAVIKAGYADAAAKGGDGAIKGDVTLVDTSPRFDTTCSECGAPEGAVHTPPCGALVGREETITVSNPANPKQAYGDKKVPLHLMPPIAEILTCVALREGAIKYGAWNFRDTRVELMTYVGAIKRHLAAIIDGEWIDPDDVVMPDGTIVDLPKKPHIAGLLASAAILADAYYNGNLVDNRPAPGKASELLKDFMAP